MAREAKSGLLNKAPRQDRQKERNQEGNYDIQPDRHFRTQELNNTLLNGKCIQVQAV
jgi:hypothetical protein